MLGDFPGGPVIKNPPSSAGEAGLIPGWGPKTRHVAQQLSPCAATEKGQAIQGRVHTPR